MTNKRSEKGKKDFTQRRNERGGKKEEEVLDRMNRIYRTRVRRECCTGFAEWSRW
jgi:hypothetical protein